MQRDGLRSCLAKLHPDAVAGGADGHVLIAQLAHDVERLLHRLLLREPQRVRLHLRLHRRPHVRRRLEKPVRRRQPFQRLVRALEIIAVDVEREPALAVLVARKHRAGEKFVPQGLPESLHLPQGLRVLRPRLEVADPLPPQLLLEARAPPPDRVLPAVVGQNLLRHSVLGDRLVQGLSHQEFFLVPGHGKAHQEAGMVIHEGADVDPLVPAQQEGEDVRLPELVGLRPLEASGLRLRPRGLRRRLHQLRLVQHAPHFRLADRERLEPLQHVPDPPGPVLRVRLLQRQHRFPPRIVGLRLPLRRPRHLGEQRLVSALRVRLSPQGHGGDGQPEGPADVAHCSSGLELLQHLQLQLQRVCLALR